MKHEANVDCFIPNRMYYIISIFLVFILGINNYALLAKENQPLIQFKISFPTEIQTQAVTGRIFLLLYKNGDIEPSLQKRPSPPLFGLDINQLQPGKFVVIDNNVPCHPVKSLRDFPEGDYYVQTAPNVYNKFNRSDGHVIWAHMDQWEGQKFNIFPGNFYSDVQKVHLSPLVSKQLKISLSNIITPAKIPENTKWVKRVKIKSELFTKFWGHRFYIGATILLPKGYNEHPDVYYPVEYLQYHFSLSTPHDFNTEIIIESESDRTFRLRNSNETGYEFYKQWISEKFNRMNCITFQHPTPFYDDSYAVNSANNGPFGDAIMNEQILYIENRFRIIKESYSNVLLGESTGGWEALTLQVYKSEFFYGSWIFYPDPADF